MAQRRPKAGHVKRMVVGDHSSTAHRLSRNSAASRKSGEERYASPMTDCLRMLSSMGPRERVRITYGYHLVYMEESPLIFWGGTAGEKFPVWLSLRRACAGLSQNGTGMYAVIT